MRKTRHRLYFRSSNFKDENDFAPKRSTLSAKRARKMPSERPLRMPSKRVMCGIFDIQNHMIYFINHGYGTNRFLEK